MKKILLLLFLLTGNIASSFAQIPDYFAGNPIWREGQTCILPNYSYPCHGNTQLIYYIKGDTSIGSIVYQKLFKRQVLQKYNMPPDPWSTCNGNEVYEGFSSLLRQIDKKIYVYNSSVGSEALLYDFNLNIGDTISMGSTEKIIIEIDSIIIGAHYRKKFHLNPTPNEASLIIEGVGTDLGLFSFYIDDDCYSKYLKCFALGDTVFYPEPYSSCDLNVGVEQKSSKTVLEIFPNPVHDNLIIRNFLNLIEPAEFYLMDQTGKSILLGRLNEGENVIQLKQLNEGIYFLLININGGIITKKIVKI